MNSPSPAPFLMALLALATAPLSAGAEMFSETMRDGKISICVEAPNTADGNTVTITPSGLANDNRLVTFATDKEVVRAWMEDIKGDGTHEFFIQLRQPGSGGYGEVKAYSTNGDKSLSEIFIAPPEEKDMTGYMGHDEFELVENTLVRRYPVYQEGDSNADPTGGYRQFQYKLEPGEAGWIFRLDRVVEY
jgi:hypothetical protein